MKTQIIQLEHHDDFISTRDKMGWNQAGRILLVWPGSRGVLDRRLDLLLLKRHSHRIGAQLALVTQDPQVRFFAKELGLPTFKAMRKAQKAAWRVRHHPPAEIPDHRPADPRKLDAAALRAERAQQASLVRSFPLAGRLLFFGLGLGAILTLATLFVPLAQIRIDPQSKLQQVTIDVQADPAADRIRLPGTVPAQTQWVVVEGRADRPTSGSMLVPQRPSAGRVVFENLTENQIEVPAGTIIRTLQPGGPRFQTQAETIVSPGVNQRAAIAVRALLPGSEGNLPPGNLVVIEGPLALSLAVNNPLPTSGGSETRAERATDEDRAALLEELTTQLRSTALNEFNLLLDTGGLVLSPTLTNTQVIVQDFQPQGDEPAETLSLSLRLEFSALVVESNHLQQIALAILEANLPAGYQGAGGPLDFQHHFNPSAHLNRAQQWQMIATRRVVAKVTPAEIASAVGGLPISRATERMRQVLPLLKPPLIDMQPQWWPWMPFLPFRISLAN